MAARGTQAAKVGLFVALTGAAAYGIYRYVSPEVGGGGGVRRPRVHQGRDGPRHALARHHRRHPGRDARLDQARERRGAHQRPGEGRRRPLRNATLGKKSASLLGESVIVLTPGHARPRAKLHDGDEIHVIVQRDHAAATSWTRSRRSPTAIKAGRQAARRLHRHRAGRPEHQGHPAEPGRRDRRAEPDHPREPRRSSTRRCATSRRSRSNANPQIAADPRERARRHRGRARAHGRRRAGQGRPEGRAPRHDRAPRPVEQEPRERARAHRQRRRPHRPRRGHDRQADQGRDAHQRGAGRRRGRERLRRQNIARLQTIVGLRTDYNFLANTIKSYVELRLQPTRGQVLRHRARSTTRAACTTHHADTTSTPPTPTSPRTTARSRRRRPTRSASRSSSPSASGPFTGRFGIKESTGGIGLDMHLLQDRFEIVNDLFGFGEEVQPRYRVYIAYEFITQPLAARRRRLPLRAEPARLLPRPAAALHRRGPEDDPAVFAAAPPPSASSSAAGARVARARVTRRRATSLRAAASRTGPRARAGRRSRWSRRPGRRRSSTSRTRFGVVGGVEDALARAAASAASRSLGRGRTVDAGPTTTSSRARQAWSGASPGRGDLEARPR